MFAEPSQPGGSGRAWVVGGAAVLVLIGIGMWLVFARGAEDPDGASADTELSAPDPSEDLNAPPAPDERTTTAPPAERTAPKSARPPAAAPAPPAAPAPTAPTLRVESDVAGAMVFLNRKYLGTTPLVSRDVSPGSYELNVQAEGLEPVVQTVEVSADGETRVAVDIKAVRLDARVPVVHKHGVGSCDGTLTATPTGLRYQTGHATDGFTLTFAQVETFAVDYLEKSLRVKQRGGRTWNFTTRDDNADPLYVFHREVEAAR